MLYQPPESDPGIGVAPADTPLCHYRDTKQWFAVYTRSRFEKKFHRSLTKVGIQSFLPMQKEKRLWSDRIKTVEVPLFPSYVFVSVSEMQMHQLFYCPGFVRLVSFNGKPCSIRPEEISLLRDIIANNYKAKTIIYCGKGDRVKIMRGPLRGWEGRVEEKRGKDRVLFHFEGIQQTLSVEVCAGDLKRL